MDRVESLLVVFREKYGHPHPLNDLLRNKYGRRELECGAKREKEVLFTWDSESNRRIIEGLDKSFQRIEALTVNNSDTEIAANAVESKLVHKYHNELNKLIDHLEDYDGRKLAEKYVKVVQKTILKLWDCKEKKYADALSLYWQENGILLEEYKTGHKMTDDEISMLEDSSLQVYMEMTEDATKDYEVIQMLRPVIHIGYLEEGEDTTEYTNICGVCRFYCLKREERSL